MAVTCRRKSELMIPSHPLHWRPQLWLGSTYHMTFFPNLVILLSILRSIVLLGLKVAMGLPFVLFYLNPTDHFVKTFTLSRTHFHMPSFSRSRTPQITILYIIFACSWKEKLEEGVRKIHQEIEQAQMCLIFCF